jgi:hypothetical protein
VQKSSSKQSLCFSNTQTKNSDQTSENRQHVIGVLAQPALRETNEADVPNRPLHLQVTKCVFIRLDDGEYAVVKQKGKRLRSIRVGTIVSVGECAKIVQQILQEHQDVYALVAHHNLGLYLNA